MRDSVFFTLCLDLYVGVPTCWYGRTKSEAEGPEAFVVVVACAAWSSGSLLGFPDQASCRYNSPGVLHKTSQAFLTLQQSIIKMDRDALVYKGE
jgi:hypothetical protein